MKITDKRLIQIFFISIAIALSLGIIIGYHAKKEKKCTRTLQGYCIEWQK